MDFSNYDLNILKEDPIRLYNLGNGVLDWLAAQFGVPLGDQPSEEALSSLIGAVGPHKELQKNIDHVREVLGPNAVDIASNWLEQSGVMNAVSGAFWNLSQPLMDRFDALVWTGGVANWMLRRRNLTERLFPRNVDRIVLALGNRQMAPDEHALVDSYIRLNDRRPTEFEFGCLYVVPLLRQAGFNVLVLEVPSNKGDEVCEAFFLDHASLLDQTILTVGNAPNTIQGAGQLRDAARRVDSSFDQNGDQLFMVGDHFPVARHGEDKSTHQNPLSGLGQIARNALLLYKAIAA